MGTVEIHDDDGTRRFERAYLDGDYRIDVQWPSQAAFSRTASSTLAEAAPTTLSGVGASPTPDGECAAAATGSRTAGPSESASGVDDPRDGPTWDDGAGTYAWLAVLPLAATLLGVVVGVVFGFGVFDTGTPGDVDLLPYVGLVPYFLVGLAGTLWLFEDAQRLAETAADWQPNPWAYVLGGGLVLELVVAAPVLRGDLTSGIVSYLAGGFVLATLLSSVVAGPVYLLVRRRELAES